LLWHDMFDVAGIITCQWFRFLWKRDSIFS
jgi:hypothetical protein